MVTHELEPVRQPVPRVKITLQRGGTLAVPLQILFHPSVPRLAVDDGSSMMLLCFQFGAQSLGLCSIVRIVGAQASGAVSFFLLAVEINHIPKRRAVSLIQVS